MENLKEEKSRLMKALFVLAILGCVYLGAKTITEMKGYRFIGGGAPASNVISFEGKGEVMASPDLATINFNLIDQAKDMKSAQEKVTAKETKVLAFLKDAGIDKKDIKTENYNSYPTYEYGRSVCPPIQVPMMEGGGGSTNPASSYYCPPDKQVLTGYQVVENISVKVRKIDSSGDIVKGLVNAGVSDLNGPNFSVDKEDKLKEQARKMAIDDAKAKAESLARDLGVHLVRIVNFSENGNYPIMYEKGLMAADSGVSMPAASPELPTGENKITSNVTITYEIR